MRILSLLCSTIALSVFAQNTPIDFESGGHGSDWTWTVFENEDNPALEIIDNPFPDAVNSSATVAKFTARQTGAPFAGCETMHGADIGSFELNASNSTVSIKVYKDVISDVGIKLVRVDSWSLGEIKVANTLVNQWETLTFDMSSNEGQVYDQLVVFPDFDLDGRDQDNVIYFDDITFGDGTTVGLQEREIALLDIHPNPSNGQFKLNLVEAGQVYVTSLDGSLIREEYLLPGRHVLSMPSGVYLVQVISESGVLRSAPLFVTE